MTSSAFKKKMAPQADNPVARLRSELSLNDAELAVLLEATPRTLYRWTEHEPPKNYRPLERLEELAGLARETLKEESLAEWFHEPNRALGGSIPIRLAADPRGYEIVRDLLGGGAHGLPV